MGDYQVDENFFNLICELRGKVIQTCVDLEMIMDGYIAEHFCDTNDKILELASIVLAPRVQWREKLAIFAVLIEKYNPSFLEEYKDFEKDISNIIEHRNVFAHLRADTTINGFNLFQEKGIIPFLKLKNSKVPVTKEIVYMRSPSYTNEEINSILKGIHTYSSVIQKMLKTGKV